MSDQNKDQIEPLGGNKRASINYGPPARETSGSSVEIRRNWASENKIALNKSSWPNGSTMAAEEADRRYLDLLLPDVDASDRELSDFLAGREHIILDSSFSYMPSFRYELGSRIQCNSAEHSVWRCNVIIGTNKYPFVLKLKRSSEGRLMLMSPAHGNSILSNFHVVQTILIRHRLEKLRVNRYFYIQIDTYRVWFEEYLPKFEKFLQYPDDPDCSLALSLSNSRRITQLQLAMISEDRPPIIDPQGFWNQDFDEIVLSDIETTATLSKFNDINAERCIDHIRRFHLMNHIARRLD